jgi:hypothetical protein
MIYKFPCWTYIHHMNARLKSHVNNVGKKTFKSLLSNENCSLVLQCLHPHKPGYCSLYSHCIWAGWPRGRGLNPATGKIFLFSMLSRTVLGPTQPPNPMGTREHFPQVSGQGVNLITHLQLVPRSRMSESIHPLPHMPSWLSAKLVRHRDNFLNLHLHIYNLFPPKKLKM